MKMENKSYKFMSFRFASQEYKGEISLFYQTRIFLLLWQFKNTVLSGFNANMVI